MATREVPVPGYSSSCTFAPESDLLGSGTVGKVFKVHLGNSDKRFALKEFLHRTGRDDFQNEQRVLQTLAATPHKHIMYFIAAWTTADASYMLFPLADQDLHHFLTSSSPPINPSQTSTWLVDQMLAVCDALKYVHEYITPGTKDGLDRRVGFHHDLKPANILMFDSSEDGRANWTLADFGSGAVKHLRPDSDEQLFNRKASTGDPVYSAPEYVIEGKVSYPKDIWSLGCIFLEVLVWALTPQAGAVLAFRQARDKFKQDNPDNRPVYWCQGSDGKPYVNPAVAEKLVELDGRVVQHPVYAPVLDIVTQMLALQPQERPTAENLCTRFEALRTANRN